MRNIGGKHRRNHAARLCAWLRHRGRDFAEGRRSAILIIVALMMIPLLLAAGGAIDVARFYTAKGQVQYALDAALLAAGASDPTANRADIFNQYFANNYPGPPAVTPTAPDFTNPDMSVFTASATLTMPTVFLHLASINNLVTTVTARIVRATTGVEVALAVDNSRTMIDIIPGDTATKLENVVTAANALRTVLFANATGPNDVKMAVVPFVATVNIGTANYDAFVDDPGNRYPTGITRKGCVEARADGTAPDYDTVDSYNPAGTSGEDGKWRPYFWETESYYWQFTLTTLCPNSWWKPDTPPSAAPPRNDPTGRFGSPAFGSSGTFETIDDHNNGPNRACPTPITPLTNDQTVIQTALNDMEVWANGGGTTINLGAVWGWRVLSPALPFNEGVAYTNTNINKVMILLTDGSNKITPQNSQECRDMITDPVERYDSRYTAYGYVSENRLGSRNLLTAQSALDDHLQTVCTNAKNAGIKIYAIIFGDDPAGTDIETAMKNCASAPENYMYAPDGAMLETKFRAIGAKLTNLRIAQ